MRIALLVLLVSSTALADVRIAGHVAAGMESGTITKVNRPDGVSEAGLRLQVFLGENWGLGVSAEVVGRLVDLGAREESKFDATFVWRHRDRGWIGVGAGVRALLYDRDGASTIVTGYDFLHLDAAIQIASWDVMGTVRVGIDAYAAMAFGCYSDSVRDQPLGDMAPAMYDVRCSETITSTLTAGIATSVRWP